MAGNKDVEVKPTPLTHWQKSPRLQIHSENEEYEKQNDDF